MKLFVKRDQFKTFQKGKIEFDDAFEWVLISGGLLKLLEDVEKTIKNYEDLQKETGEDFYSDIENCINRKTLLEEMMKELEHPSELVWE